MPGQTIYVRLKSRHLLDKKKAENGSLTFIERQLESLSLILQLLAQNELPAQSSMAGLPSRNNP